MKKLRVLPLIFILFLLGFSTLILFEANATTMKTTVKTSSLGNVQANYMKDFNVSIDHTVKILQAGSVAINDTVQLSAKQNTTLTEYPLGFPYGYKYRLAYVSAFNSSNPAQIYNVSLDTGLGNNIGFYGVTVIFPQGGVQLRVGKPFRFTVVFVFSDVVISSTYTYLSETVPPKRITSPILTVNYPMFPSLLQNASVANVTVTTPPGTVWEGSSGSFNFKESLGTSQVVNFISRSLPALTYAPGWFNFSVSSGSIYQLVTIDNLERHAEIDGQGNILIKDAYTITNHMPQSVASFYPSLPPGASDVTAYDSQGNSIAATLVDKNTTTYSLSFGFSVNQRESTQFAISYFLPLGNYTDKTGNSGFDLNIPVAGGLNSVVGKLTFEISLPMGASIKDYPSIKQYDLQNDVLQQRIILTAYNVSSLNNINLHLSYVYSVFWASFSPTLWMTTIVAVGIVIAIFWRAKPTASIPVPSVAAKPQTLKALVSSYEERTKAALELESLERQVQKGRLPRRRYKIRKRMLESQISRLDRELADLKQRAKSMGPRYTEIFKDLEIAEAELEGIEAEERRATARYRAGAYTLDAYRRMQEQYNKRRERAKTTIEGALLRLSEGIA
jgi:hypothetical protein